MQIEDLLPDQLDLIPRDSAIQEFSERGFWISPPILASSLLDDARVASSEYYSGEMHDGPEIPEQCVPTGTYSGLRKHDYSSLRRRELASLVEHPMVAATAARLIGAQSLRLWRDELLFKPGTNEQSSHAASTVGWHRDRAYWLTCTSSRMVTAWIPFVDITEDMGPLLVIPGSHKWPFDPEKDRGFFDWNLDARLEELRAMGLAIDPVAVTLKRGQVSFHSCLLLHGSSSNLSAKPRQNLVVHLQDGENRYQRFVLPDGEIARDWNDDLVRKDAQGFPDYRDPRYCPTLWGPKLK